MLQQFHALGLVMLVAAGAGMSISNTRQVLAQSAIPPRLTSTGDYTPNDHPYWQVVDSDPNGLNCRMLGRGYSYDDVFSMDSTILSNDIRTMPVVGVLKQGQYFEVINNLGGDNVTYDSQDKPWMFVTEVYGDGSVRNCFVRAHQNFVQPVWR